MEELASAKRSHNAHKGLFGQRIKAFESRVASFKRSPEVPQNWAEVEDAFDKVCKQTVGDGTKGVASRVGVQDMVHWRSYQEHQGQRP